MTIPIRIRLTVVYCTVFLVVMAALGVGTYVSLRAAVQTVVDRELDTRLAGLDDHITRHVNRYSWPELADQLRAHPAFQPSLLRITDIMGAVQFAGTEMPASIALLYTAVPARATIEAEGHTLRVMTIRRTIQGRTYDLTLGTDLLVMGAILDRLWFVLVGSIPLVLFVASWAGYWISGRALAPVSHIIASAAAIDSTRLDARIDVPNTGDEIAQLATATNGMLDRIEDGMRRIRQFTADASHELRTPIGIIRASAEVSLMNGSVTARDYRAAMQRILFESEQSSRLLEDLLYLARTDARAVQIRQDPVDLSASLELACTQAEPLAMAKGVSITCSRTMAPGSIRGDEEQLRRLWLILLDNAVKYTPRGGRITVDFRIDGTGRPACIVRDTGIGIAPEHLSHVFERFYRVEKARTRNGSGTGLGLAIAREIARLHGAAIDVQSTPGSGSIFTVRFAAVHDAVMKNAS